ncbi:hypothetical protein ACFWBX_08870 [Streptomyces sp. NPDC059991]|uniref:hypothetical protein n=1 Tax=Streptomyces sp. NPDC059991 TaxID=3347028 RepID=UPI0036AF7F20
MSSPSPSLRPPASLRARWRDVPGYARLLQRRLSPPAATRISAVTGVLMWLLVLAFWQADGRLLGRGSAVLAVQGPRIRLRRRLAALGMLLAAALMLALLALGLGTAAALLAAVCGLPAALAGNSVAIAFGVLLVAEMARTLRGISSSVAVTRARRAHRRTGGTWWEVGQLAAAEDDPVSAGRLVHAALRQADTHGIGLVAAARTPALERAYRRLGFCPDPAHPPALIRLPGAAHRTRR